MLFCFRSNFGGPSGNSNAFKYALRTNGSVGHLAQVQRPYGALQQGFGLRNQGFRGPINNFYGGNFGGPRNGFGQDPGAREWYKRSEQRLAIRNRIAQLR